MHEPVAVLLVSELFERVGPEDVAHEAVRRGLTEAVDLLDPNQVPISLAARK